MDDKNKFQIPASEHPKALNPRILLLNVILSAIGAIIGMELIVRTGVTANTSIVGALFAIILSRIPIGFLKKFRSVHEQNLVQTAISGATFSAANTLILPIGIPVLMGRPELMYPMLIGVFLATIIDATILWKTFDSPMFPAEGAWAPGVASAETIKAVVNKGKKAMLLLAGMAMGVVGKIAGLPMDLLGVSWFANFGAMAALAVGSVVIGIIKTNGFGFAIFGHSFNLASNIFGEGFAYSEHTLLNYLPHGFMIGAGLVALIQCILLLTKKESGAADSAMSKFTGSMASMKKAMGGGFVAYMAVALVIGVVMGLITNMGFGMFIIWLVFTAFAALASELIVGIAAMHSGWFPGFATALVFLLLGMLIGFPPLALAVMVGYTAATGPCFADMAYDLKCGYMLRGYGSDPELEKEGRKQQFICEIIGFVVAAIIVAIMAKTYFAQDLFAPSAKSFVVTIEAGTNLEVAKALLIWAIPGAILQWVGGERQLGILFATGLLVGNIINGLTIIVALIIRLLYAKDENRAETLTILGAGSLAGAALYSFFSSTLGLVKKK